MRAKQIISMMICIALVLSMYGCDKKSEIKKATDYGRIEQKDTYDGWEQIISGQAQIENDSMTLCINADDGHFSIADKANNTVYSSAVVHDLEGALIERNGKAQSEILAYYYDEKGQEQELNSYDNSVTYKNFKLLKKDNCVRVFYTFQLEAAPPFVPQILTEDMISQITESVDGTTFFKIKMMYKYFSSDKDDVDTNEMKSKYPYIKENNAYVIKENLNDSDAKALGRYMEKAGFDETEYYNKLEELNIELQEDDVPLQFVVPVEYTLNNDGFSVKVLSEQISTTNDEFQIQSVAVLPFFNCGVVQEENAYWLLPDGSGSIMKANKIDNRGYSQKIYGRDMACANQQTSIIDKYAVMPIIGFSSNEGSWFARINGSGEMSEVSTYRSGDTEYATHGYAKFTILSVDGLKVRKSSIERAVLAKNISSERPEITYKLLKKNASIMNFVECYKDILKKEGIIEKKETNNNLYLDFLGYVTEEASFLGVSYEKKVVLSTIQGIKDSVNKLLDSGIKNIYVRLTGYSNGGKYHSQINEFSLDSDVGTIDELEELADLLESSGGALYLEDDVHEVFKDSAFDGFTASSDAIRALDKTIVDISDNNIVTGDTDDKSHIRYLTAPKLYKALVSDFVNELNKKIEKNNIGISIGNAGKYITSDFSEDSQYDRVQSKNAILDAVDSVLENGEFMTNTGNEYILAQSSHILNIPLADSAYNAENYHIPFYEMVLKGYINFAGTALNDAENIKKNEIWTLLSGANPYYMCVTENAELEQLKGEQKRYPEGFNTVFNKICEFYNKNNELYEITNNSEITSFEVLSDGLYKVCFDDKAVLFNETDLDTEYNKQIIKADNYLILGK